MTMSVKMLAEIAAHAQAMADEAQAMATAMQAVVNDCAEQMAAKQGTDGTNGENSATDATDAKATATDATNATSAKATNTTSAKATEATTAKATNTTDAKTTDAPGSAGTTPPWVAEAEANIQPPKPEPGKKLTIAEVRAYVAERSKPENRARIRAILKRFGVAKLTELPEAKYEAMMEEVAKL